MTKAHVVHAYCRASTEDQTTEQQQDAILAAYADSTTFQWYCELTSGWQGRRSEYDALCTSIIKGRVRELVAVNIARLGRNQREALKLLQLCVDHSVKIRILDTPLDFSGPIGTALFALFAAFAQMDSDTKSENIKRKFRLKKKQDPDWVMHGNIAGTVSEDMKRKAPRVYQMLDQGESIREIAYQCGLSTSSVQKIKRLRGKMLLTRKDYAAMFPGWHLLPLDKRPPIPDLP